LPKGFQKSTLSALRERFKIKLWVYDDFEDQWIPKKNILGLKYLQTEKIYLETYRENGYIANMLKKTKLIFKLKLSGSEFTFAEKMPYFRNYLSKARGVAKLQLELVCKGMRRLRECKEFYFLSLSNICESERKLVFLKSAISSYHSLRLLTMNIDGWIANLNPIINWLSVGC